MTDLNEIMRQAKQMQEQFQKAQQDIASIVVEGESGGGMVKISMNGRHDVLSVNINDSLLSEGKSVIEDLFAAAVNDSVRKLEEKNKETLGSMTGAMNLPSGFKLPF
ncbi:MAG TPA: YbaB/EbfC family nucleoid-associated protein [Porticoccaceae bacterium]|jgi:DNA-binding YbaB/EbfC family protein|nr:YbaB/EbfC family nucleoid-associated protein [Gammaproteobacteria bacterium]HIL59353.1 YbaB/EbfC family nucleoid-associated protein [Porticoccaceae bacterium]